MTTDANEQTEDDRVKDIGDESFDDELKIHMKAQEGYTITEPHIAVEKVNDRIQHDESRNANAGEELKTKEDNVESSIEIQTISRTNNMNPEGADSSHNSLPHNETSTETVIKQNLDNYNTFAKLNTESDEKPPPVGWIPADTQRQRKMSNYLQNITISSSNLGLSLGGSEKKETALLNDSKTVIRFSPVWKQTLASAASIILTIATGLTSGYSAILLPQLKAEHNPMYTGEDTASWIAAMAALPMGPGCLISGWMMERLGRRTSLYIACLPMFLGWMFIACAYNLGLMLIGRFFIGLCAGLLGPLSPVYIAETTDPKYRGFFLAVVSLAIAVGIMIVQLIGTYMSWQWTAIICSIFPLLALIPLTVVPESPTWLISKGRLEDGIKAFYWLRGHGNDAKIELKGILDRKKSLDSEPKMDWKEKLLSLKSPMLLKPLVIMIVFFVTSQFSGVNAIAFYSIEIAEKAVGTGVDHYTAMLAIDALRVVMSLVACVLSRRYGRRPLCFISGIWTAISMAGLAAYLFWKPDNMVWIPLLCLMSYICAISVGLVPLPWVMCGEVFPTRVRGLGSGISSATTFVAFFIVVKTAPGMMTNLGEVITFLIYGGISLVGTAVLFFILPETKGKSLQEIEEKFSRRRHSMLFI